MNPIRLATVRRMLARNYDETNIAHAYGISYREACALVRAVRAQERWGETAPIYLTDDEIRTRQEIRRHG